MKKQSKILNVYFENDVKVSVYESIHPTCSRTPIRVTDFVDDLFEEFSRNFLQEI